MENSNQFKILSCAGGGFFCFGQALILAELERRSGKPVWQLFDAMGGTSGGAINTGLLALGVSAEKLATFYTQYAPLVFHKDYADIEADTGLAPRYDNTELINALKELTTMQTADGERLATLKDCKVPWMCVTLNVSTSQPELACSWCPSEETPFGKIIGYDDPREMWELILDSVSAPTYFKGVQQNGQVYVDGGLTGNNSPDSMLCSIFTEMSAGKQIRMLSLGSGNAPWPWNGDEMINPSVITVAHFVLNTFLDCDVDSSNLAAFLKLRHNYFHLCPTYNPTFNMADVSTGLSRIPIAISDLIQKNQATLEEFAPVCASSSSAT